MTVEDLLNRMSSSELTEWKLVYQLRNQERAAASKQ